MSVLDGGSHSEGWDLSPPGTQAGHHVGHDDYLSEIDILDIA